LGNGWEQKYLDLMKINMQALLDRTTTQRIIRKSSRQEIEIRTENIETIYKWGCDSSSERVQYKRKISSENYQTVIYFCLLLFQYNCVVLLEIAMRK